MAYELFSLSLQAKSQEMLKSALDIVFAASKDGTLTHYRKQTYGFFFYEYPHEEAKELPTPLNFATAREILLLWLYNEAEYPPEPDVDGSCQRGYLLLANKNHGPLISLNPSWIIYHK